MSVFPHILRQATIFILEISRPHVDFNAMQRADG